MTSDNAEQWIITKCRCAVTHINYRHYARLALVQYQTILYWPTFLPDTILDTIKKLYFAVTCINFRQTAGLAEIYSPTHTKLKLFLSRAFFIWPKSDHSLPMSITSCLTDWLTRGLFETWMIRILNETLRHMLVDN